MSAPLKLYVGKGSASGASHGILTRDDPRIVLNPTTGWVLDTATGYSPLVFLTFQASGTFAAPALPSGAPSTADCFRSVSKFSGTIEAGNWLLSLTLVAFAVSGGVVRAEFRVWRGTDPAGAGATQITAGTVEGTQLSLDSSDQNSTASTAIGLVTLRDEYVFLQIALRSIGPGGAGEDANIVSTSSVVNLGNGIGVAAIETPLFRDGWFPRLRFGADAAVVAATNAPSSVAMLPLAAAQSYQTGAAETVQPRAVPAFTIQAYASPASVWGRTWWGFGPLVFDTISLAVGTAAGTGAAAGVGAAASSVAGTSAGAGAATGVGAATSATAGTASGTGTASGVAAATSAAAGSITGTGTAAGVAAATAEAVASAPGAGAAAGAGAATSEAVGSAAGTGAGSGAGAASSEAIGDASGTASTAAIGAADSAAVGTASGIAAVDGVGDSEIEEPTGSVGVAAGSASASGVGAATSASVGTAAGAGTVLGVGGFVLSPAALLRQASFQTPIGAGGAGSAPFRGVGTLAPQSRQNRTGGSSGAFQATGNPRAPARPASGGGGQGPFTPR